MLNQEEPFEASPGRADLPAAMRSIIAYGLAALQRLRGRARNRVEHLDDHLLADIGLDARGIRPPEDHRQSDIRRLLMGRGGL